MPAVVNIAAYRFAPLDGLKALRAHLTTVCREWGIKGTILLSTEGINLFVAGSAAVLSLTGDFVYRGPILTPNGLLALCTTSAAAAAVRAVHGRRFSNCWWAVSAAALGLGVLAKGPVAAGLVLPPLLAYAVRYC